MSNVDIIIYSIFRNPQLPLFSKAINKSNLANQTAYECFIQRERERERERERGTGINFTFVQADLDLIIRFKLVRRP